LKVHFFPRSTNPYQYLLGEALTELGVEVDHQARLPSPGWLWANRAPGVVLHLHWPHMLYRTQGKPPTRWPPRVLFQLGLARRLLALALKLSIARTLGYRIIWTAHNLLPHDTEFYRGADIAARYVVLALADAVIAHCHYARAEVRRRFGRQKNVHVIPIGSYIHTYSDPIPKAEARSRMAIDPDVFVYLFFGKIRPYKQLDTLIAAFERMADDSLLLVAGACKDDEMRGRLLDKSRTNDCIRLFLQFIPDEQVPLLFGAADAIVTPFSRILTSASVVLGLSMARPVIAPALGCLPELVSPDVGTLYDPTDEDALARAMREARSWDLATMSDQARKRALELDWPAIARSTLDVYRHCCENRGPA